MTPADLDLARSLFPRVLFDRAEPFFPVWIGVSVVTDSGRSPSFRRDLAPPPGGRLVEYAVYWDWDIQHLYDLEHLWLSLDAQGRVVDAEGSFHGRYLKALLPDRSNLEEQRVTVFSQPGKHAFAPDPLVFRLLPDADLACLAAAGKAGAEVPGPLNGRIVHRPEWDPPVAAWLTRRRFQPSWQFAPWVPSPEIFVPWTTLNQRLPDLFLHNLSLAGAL